MDHFPTKTTQLTFHLCVKRNRENEKYPLKNYSIFAEVVKEPPKNSSQVQLNVRFKVLPLEQDQDPSPFFPHALNLELHREKKTLLQSQVTPPASLCPLT